MISSKYNCESFLLDGRIVLSPNYAIPVRAQCIVVLVVTCCDACCFEVILSYCFMIISQKMSNNGELEETLNETHCSSFFQSSCPSNGFISEKKEADEEVNVDSPTPRRGGYTCCVPYCFSNSKKNKHLSFYSFPDGKSKEKQLLRMKWLHMVSRKDFVPPMEDTPGGKKTYMNNVPTLTQEIEKKALFSPDPP